MDKKEFDLTDNNINAATEKIRTYLTGRKASESEVLKAVLLVEETLLRFRDRFGSRQAVSVETAGLIVAVVRIRVEAEQYDPLRKNGAETILDSELIRNLTNTQGISARYWYHGGVNEIIVSARKERKDLKIPGGAVTAGS